VRTLTAPPPGLSPEIPRGILLASEENCPSQPADIDRDRYESSCPKDTFLGKSARCLRDPRMATPVSGILPQPKMCPGGAGTPRGADDTYRRGDDVTDRNRSYLDLLSGKPEIRGDPHALKSGPRLSGVRSGTRGLGHPPPAVVAASPNPAVTRGSGASFFTDRRESTPGGHS
jgi:hypothetical protein